MRMCWLLSITCSIILSPFLVNCTEGQ